MAKVSVIVPVYNSRDYVTSCVNSLLAQTLDELELVFVDDHGADGSFSVIQDKLSNYKGPKEIVYTATEKNSGPGAARNAGLAIASGEYIAFVDSDDWIDATFCESMYNAAIQHNADLVYCNICLNSILDGSAIIKTNPTLPSGTLKDEDRRSFLATYVSFFTTFLYRRAFLSGKGIHFPQTRSSEDSAFLATCILCARSISSVPGAMYHYVQGHHSLSSGALPMYYPDRIKSFDCLMDYAAEHSLYSSYKAEIDFIYIKKAFLMSCKTYASGEKRPDVKVLRDLCRSLDKKIPDNAANVYVLRQPKVRLAVWLVRNCPRLACVVLKRIGA